MNVCLIFFVLQATTNLGAVFAEKIETELLIVNGTNANIRDFPYHVSVRKGNGHFCGGSLIYPDIVITAAHCLDSCKKSNIKMYSVMAGSALVSGGIFIPVAKYICNKKYSSETADNDVALIKLLKKYKLSQYINTIKLVPTNYKLPVGKYGIVTGWGALDESGNSMPNVLQKTTIQIISNKLCNKLYWNDAITLQMFCAGPLDGHTDSCFGDSGGPFVLKKSKLLLGLVSWGIGCARPNYPGVYSRISTLRKWIDLNLKKLK